MQIQELLKSIKNKYSILVVFTYAAILLITKNHLFSRLSQPKINILCLVAMFSLFAAGLWSNSRGIKESLKRVNLKFIKIFLKANGIDLAFFLLFFFASFCQAKAYLAAFKIAFPNSDFIISLGKISPLTNYLTFENLVGVLAGTTTCFTYLFFRQTLKKSVSIALTLLLLSSALQLDHLIPFWNKYYIRAPILIFFLTLLTNIAIHPRDSKQLRALIPILGVSLGAGMIFRPGLFLFSFLAYATLLFLLPNKEKTPIRERVVLALLFYIFYTGTYTLKRSYRFQKNTSHAFLGGTTPFFDARLGLVKPNYDSHYLHLDEYTTDLACANSETCRTQRETLPMKEHFSPEAQDNQMKRIFLNFPADAMARFIAATFRVLEVPFTYTLPARAVDKGSNWHKFLEIRTKLLSPLNNTGLAWALIAFFIVGIINPYSLIYLLLLVASLCILPFIHIIGYYFFYMEFVGLWCFGASAQFALVFIKKLIKRKGFPKVTKQLLQNLAISIALFLLPISLLLASRLIQSKKVHAITEQYSLSSRVKVPIEKRNISRNRVLVTNAELFKQGPKPTFKIYMLEAIFDRQSCKMKTVFPLLRYQTDVKRMDWSRSLRVELSKDELTKVYFPAFIQNSLKHEAQHNFFAGIEVSTEASSCFKELSYLPLKEIPFLLNFQEPLMSYSYKVFDFEKSWNSIGGNRKKLGRTNTYLTSSNTNALSSLVKFRGKSIAIQGHVKDATAKNKFFPIQGPPWKIAKDGYPNPEALLINTDLLLSDLQNLEADSSLSVEGVLVAGGAMFIVFDQFNNVVERKTITQTGDFTFNLPVDKKGLYRLGISNYIAFYQTLENNLLFSAYWGQK
jgi:hypothetical protein